MPPFDKLRRATVPAPNFHILTRVMQDRRRAKGAGLSATGANFQEADTRTIVLARRGPHAPGRTARLTRRFGTVVLNRPRGSARDLLPSVRLTLVEVAEHDPPAGGEPLHWRRLTTHDVTSVDAAWQIVAWYKLRWIIEQLFRILKKQGLQLEDSQIASAERLLKRATIATKAAALLLQLVQARDRRRAEPASLAFTQEEMAALEAVNAQVEGKTGKQKNPHTRRGRAWAAWIIARLGGWPFDKLRRLLLLPAARSHHLQAWPGILSRPRYGMGAEKCVHPLGRRLGEGDAQRNCRQRVNACGNAFSAGAAPMTGRTSQLQTGWRAFARSSRSTAAMGSSIPSCRPSRMASSRMLMAICQIFRSASGPSLFRNERAAALAAAAQGEPIRKSRDKHRRTACSISLAHSNGSTVFAFAITDETCCTERTVRHFVATAGLCQISSYSAATMRRAVSITMNSVRFASIQGESDVPGSRVTNGMRSSLRTLCNIKSFR